MKTPEKGRTSQRNQKHKASQQSQRSSSHNTRTSQRNYPRTSQRSYPRVIGFDPGLASTGWGVLDFVNGKILHIDHGTIITKPDSSDAMRLCLIMRSVKEIVEKFKPSGAAIEILFFGKNAKSAISVAQARGVILSVLAERCILLHELTPNAIKKGVTGSGSADKKQVQEMVRLLLNLEKIPKPDHAADALAAAICAVNYSSFER